VLLERYAEKRRASPLEIVMPEQERAILLAEPIQCEKRRAGQRANDNDDCLAAKEQVFFTEKCCSRD